MERARRVSCILTIVVLMASCLAYGGLSLQGVALAAGAESNGDEPFAEERVTVADPLEHFNRAMFQFNDKLYFWVLKPSSVVYAAYFPPGVRVAFRNAFSNALMPVRVVNNTLQGKFDGAGIELARFIINTTLGCGGLIDFASSQYGLNPHEEDLGQTLGFYGMKPVIFINWPFLGPSSLRDTIGTAGDTFLNPIYYIPVEWYETGLIRAGMVLNNTSLRIGEYEDFKKSALDPYVAMRDAYINYRANEIKQ